LPAPLYDPVEYCRETTISFGFMGPPNPASRSCCIAPNDLPDPDPSIASGMDSKRSKFEPIDPDP
jgi:hypothetical protein